ncbi:MAG: hypothetical protein VX938_01530, partial [Myxococcota bacterium]|nr:hypothetical protein [Myxococcota bacterium]
MHEIRCGRTLGLINVVLALTFLGGCQSPKGGEAGTEEPGAAAEAVKEAAPLILEVDPKVPKMGDLADQSEVARARSPWDNFRTHDPLALNFINPKMKKVLETYKADFDGTLLRQGVLDFQLIAAFYREGMLSREDRDAQ